MYITSLEKQLDIIYKHIQTIIKRSLEKGHNYYDLSQSLESLGHLEGESTGLMLTKVRVYVCVYVCMYVCMYVCIYIYI